MELQEGRSLADFFLKSRKANVNKPIKINHLFVANLENKYNHRQDVKLVFVSCVMLCRDQRLAERLRHTHGAQNADRLSHKLQAPTRRGEERGGRAPDSHLIAQDTSLFIKNQLSQSVHTHLKCVQAKELRSADIQRPVLFLSACL